MFQDNPDKVEELESKLLKEIRKGGLDNSFYWRLNLNNEVKHTN